jgi:hypothetical protein
MTNPEGHWMARWTTVLLSYLAPLSYSQGPLLQCALLPRSVFWGQNLKLKPPECTEDPRWCKEHHIYPLILRSYRLKLQCSNHHVQSTCFSAQARLAPISTHLSTPCPCWFTGKLSQLLWKRSLRTWVHALHIVTYILITRDCALFGLVPCAFALIDTVYRDLTGLLVHTLCTLPTP